jgi:4-amino-4-deoxy-L-arabinose transferase-like glycosyltransferase
MPRHRTLLAIVVLTLAGLVLRLALSRYYTLEGTGCDGASYMNVARNLSGGDGFVINSLRFLFLPPSALPQPDAHWSPLFPLATSLSFALFGPSHAAASVMPLLIGALVPAAVFLFALALTRSRRAALIACALAAFHPSLVAWSLMIMTEIGSVFFTVLTLGLLMHPRTEHRPWLAGAALGLAWLMKYQSILLWIAVVLYVLLNTPWRVGLRRLAIAGAVFVAVIAPWLVRNAVVFGDPLYTDLRYNMISYYTEFGSEPRYLGSLTVPPSTWEFMRTHAASVVAHTKTGVRTVTGAFLAHETMSAALWPLALAGVVIALRAWRRWVPLAAFAAALVGIVGATIPQVRYIYVLIPIWLALVAVGTTGLWDLSRRGAPAGAGVRIVVSLLVAFAAASGVRASIAAARDTSAAWSPSANYCALEAMAAREFIQTHTAPSDAVMVAETFHTALLFERNTIHTPYDESGLRKIADRYHTRYLVITERDLGARLPSWVQASPSWARLAHVIPAAEIPRPRANPDYGFVSEVRIYELGL